MVLSVRALAPSWLIDPIRVRVEREEPSPRGPSGAPNSLCLMTAESHYSSLSCEQLSSALIRATASSERNSCSEGVCAPSKRGLRLLTGNSASHPARLPGKGEPGWGRASCPALSDQGPHRGGGTPAAPATTGAGISTPQAGPASSWEDRPPGCAQHPGNTPSFFGGAILTVAGEEVHFWGLSFKQVGPWVAFGPDAHLFQISAFKLRPDLNTILLRVPTEKTEQRVETASQSGWGEVGGRGLPHGCLLCQLWRLLWPSPIHLP